MSGAPVLAHASRPDGLTIDVVDRFDDPRVARGAWDRLVPKSARPSIFMTWDWQSAWWQSFGRGRLLILAIRRGDELVALAPLFLDGGMLFFVGSGGSDYLDFIGNVGQDEVDDLLGAALRAIPDALGIRLYHVPDESPTGALLQRGSEGLSLICVDEGDLPAPLLDLSADSVHRSTTKASLLRHERRLLREGSLSVVHSIEPERIAPQLDTFFEQHVSRWSGTAWPSLFNDPRQRAFYREVTARVGSQGRVVFTQVAWNGRPVAFHFGLRYAGEFLWYKPAFDITLARYSPGEVLLRHLILHATSDDAQVFDFGLGDEAFKQRFATRTRRVRTWGLYPKEQR